MNFYFSEYPVPKGNPKSVDDWFNYGKKCLWSLFKFLDPTLSDSLYRKGNEFFEYRPMKKNEIIINIGDVADSFFYIIKGSVQQTMIENENKIIVNLLSEGNIVTSVNSFFTNEPSVTSLEALENGHLLELKKVKLNLLINSEFNAQILHLFNIIMGAAFRHIEKNSLMLKMNNTTKLEYLNKEYPSIFERFKYKDIAKFSNMKLETMSRLRNK